MATVGVRAKTLLGLSGRSYVDVDYPVVPKVDRDDPVGPIL